MDNFSIINEEDCKQILESCNEMNATLKDYCIMKTSSDTVGFLGEYFQLKLYYETGHQVKEEYFFLKTIPISNQHQKEFVEDCGVFKKEAFIYQKIIPELLKGTELPLFAPRCFLVKENVLVLENLRKKNFNISKEDYTLDECKLLLETLAHFHASSIIYEEKRTKSNGFLILKQYMEKLPEGTFSFQEGNPKHKWLKSVTDCITDLMEADEVHDEETQKHFLEIIYGGKMKKLIEPSDLYRNVLTHCDLSSNNILLLEGKKCMLVDYQLVRYIPPAYDVMMALHLNLCTDVLDRNLQFLVNFYYETLSNDLRNHQLKIESVLPLSEFLETIEIYKIPAIIESTMFSLTVYLPEDISAYIRSDPERYQSYTFSSKTAHVMKALESNPKYRKKIMGLLKTLISVVRNSKCS